jgi:hypothetical protein
MIFRILGLLFLCGISIVFAQNNQNDIQSLENDFKSFEYKRVLEKGSFLLADPFTNRDDSLYIYQLMLSAAYAMNDTLTARKLVQDILRCEPRFAPNPKETSPKIIEFFNIVKSQTVLVKPGDSRGFRRLAGPDSSGSGYLKTSSLLTSVILPGSGHIIIGRRREGLIKTTSSALLAGAILYTAIETGNRRHDYMKARGNMDYDKLYDRYNQYYKIRNSAMILYGLWSLYNLYDLNMELTPTLHYSPVNKNISASITYAF